MHLLTLYTKAVLGWDSRYQEWPRQPVVEPIHYRWGGWGPESPTSCSQSNSYSLYWLTSQLVTEWPTSDLLSTEYSERGNTVKHLCTCCHRLMLIKGWWKIKVHKTGISHKCDRSALCEPPHLLQVLGLSFTTSQIKIPAYLEQSL